MFFTGGLQLKWWWGEDSNLRRRCQQISRQRAWGAGGPARASGALAGQSSRLRAAVEASFQPCAAKSCFQVSLLA